MEKKQNILVITTIAAVLASLLTVAYIVCPASALVDFDAYKGVVISDDQIDGTIGTEWDDAGHYTGVAIDPQGTAEIWTKHDGTNLYIAIRFTADSSDPWLALQLGTAGCMDSTADVAIFGHNTLEPAGYKDAYFPTGSSVDADTAAGGSQDGVGAMSVGAGNLITIELKKPLSSVDSAGNDIAWTEDSEYSLVIAWDSDGGGSSGGGVSHRRGTTPTQWTILIDPNPKPSVTPENNPPIADFDYTIKELTVNFTDKSTDPDGTIVSWFWDFGDDTNSTEKNPSHTYSEMGTYRVSLRVTDDKGDTNTVSTAPPIMVPSAEQRMQLWITQVVIITIAIAFVSFTAVLIARKIEAKRKGK